jgi:hypothetical protein
VQQVVSCFAGSATALARLKVSEGPATWLESLRWLRPDLAIDDRDPEHGGFRWAQNGGLNPGGSI